MYELFHPVPGFPGVFFDELAAFQTEDERRCSRFLFSDECPLSLRGGQADQQFIERAFRGRIPDLNFRKECFFCGLCGGESVFSEEFQRMEPWLGP